MYRSPRPDDILFRYCIMARGLSRDRHNQLVEEIANEVDGKEDIHMLAVASQQINKMGIDLLELFENSLSLIPEQRWGMEEAAQSRWMKGREIIRHIQGGISDLISNNVILNQSLLVFNNNNNQHTSPYRTIAHNNNFFKFNFFLEL